MNFSSNAQLPPAVDPQSANSADQLTFSSSSPNRASYLSPTVMSTSALTGTRTTARTYLETNHWLRKCDDRTGTRCCADLIERLLSFGQSLFILFLLWLWPYYNTIYKVPYSLFRMHPGINKLPNPGRGSK